MWQAVKSIDHIFYDMFKKIGQREKISKKKRFSLLGSGRFSLTHTSFAHSKGELYMSGGSQLTVRVLESDIELKRDRPIKEFFREM